MDTKPPHFFRQLTITLAASTLLASPVVLASEAFEREQLTLLLKQISNAHTIAATAHKQISPTDTDRYWLDYERLERDLKRIQHGVEHYLSPHRAQPRELYDEISLHDGAVSYTRDRRELPPPRKGSLVIKP